MDVFPGDHITRPSYQIVGIYFSITLGKPHIPPDIIFIILWTGWIITIRFKCLLEWVIYFEV